MLRVIKNAAYLVFIQGLGYLSPLLVSYLIIHRSGIEAFGQYSVYFSLALYCQVLFDMGHQFTATRRIAASSADNKKVSLVFWNVYAAKMTVLVFGLLLALVLASITKLSVSLLLASVGYGAAAASLPIWYFHGADKFRQIAILVFLSRLFSLILILVLYGDGESVAWVLLHQSWPNLLVTFGVTMVLLKKQKIIPVNAVAVHIRDEFRGTLHVMSANLGGNAMANLPVLMLGLLKGDYFAGVYAGADRLAKVMTSAMVPLSQAAFPVNSSKFSISTAAGLRSVLLLGGLILTAFTVMLIVVWFVSDFYFLYFNLPDESKAAFWFLMGWLFWGVLNNILGIQGFLAAGYARIYNYSVWIAVAVTLSLLFVLIPRYGVIGAAFSVFLGEASMFFLMLSYVAWLAILHKYKSKGIQE